MTLPALVLPALMIAATVIALAYGLVWRDRAPTIGRAIIKTLPVLFLAIAAAMVQTPGHVLLASALMLSALGDYFLAREPSARWLPFGMGAFFVAHLSYIALFLSVSTMFVGPSAPPMILLAQPLRGLGLLAVIGLAAVVVVRLWRDFGPLRPAVATYMVAIVAMVAAGLTLPTFLWPAMLGAVMFMISDAILSVQIFKDPTVFGRPRLAGFAIWFLYFFGQLMIFYAFTS